MSDENKIDDLLKDLLPKKGAAFLSTVQTLESLLKTAKTITYRKLENLKKDSSDEAEEEWWTCFRALLLIYLTLSEVILEACDYLIPLTEEKTNVPEKDKFKKLPRYSAQEIDAEELLEEILKKLKEENEEGSGNILILPGDDSIN